MFARPAFRTVQSLKGAGVSDPNAPLELSLLPALSTGEIECRPLLMINRVYVTTPKELREEAPMPPYMAVSLLLLQQ
jgi:hypothetical protein